MDKYTRDRLAECQTETERQNVLAFIRIETKQEAKTMTRRITLTPMNWRDYKSKREIIEALEAGNDFTIADMSSQWDGKACNLEQLVAEYDELCVYFKKQTKSTVIKLNETGIDPKSKPRQKKKKAPQLFEGWQRDSTLDITDPQWP